MRYKFRLLFFACIFLSARLDLAFCKAFFAPQDNLTSLLIEYIDAEQKSIKAAIYMFTDKKIAQALINASNRGVDVQIIIDQASMSSYGKGKFLLEQGICVCVHRTEDFNHFSSPLMHHKFFIFGCSKESKTFLWTGSWNCTVRGNQHNDENVIVLDDLDLIHQFIQAFDVLKARICK